MTPLILLIIAVLATKVMLVFGKQRRRTVARKRAVRTPEFTITASYAKPEASEYGQRTAFDGQWRSSESHRRFLVRFATPYSISDEWERERWAFELGESVSSAIRRFIKEGILEPADVEGKVIVAFTAEQLKEMCRSRELKVGGNKRDLAQRLCEADRDEMQTLTTTVQAFQCTVAGGEMIRNVDSGLRDQKARLLGDIGNTLRVRDFAKAVQIAGGGDEFEVGRIFSARPKILSCCSDEGMLELRIAAATEMLLNEPRVAKKLLSGKGVIRTGMDNDAAAKMIVFYLGAKGQLAMFREAGVKKIRITCTVDSMTCEVCEKENGKVYYISDAPELPHIHCTSEYGCRCDFEAVDIP